ncbi:hypothetical protein BAUCODRAFT_30396, partial [Baudoinia panamericana UAMH 10762]
MRACEAAYRVEKAFSLLKDCSWLGHVIAMTFAQDKQGWAEGGTSSERFTQLDWCRAMFYLSCENLPGSCCCAGSSMLSVVWQLREHCWAAAC